MKTTTKKTTNIEGRFFGMIVLAWAVLAVMFNVLHRELPQLKTPAKTGVHGAAGAPAATAEEVTATRI
jgi:hypothetical protein